MDCEGYISLFRFYRSTTNPSYNLTKHGRGRLQTSPRDALSPRYIVGSDADENQVTNESFSTSPPDSCTSFLPNTHNGSQDRNSSSQQSSNAQGSPFFAQPVVELDIGTFDSQIHYAGLHDLLDHDPRTDTISQTQTPRRASDGCNVSTNHDRREESLPIPEPRCLYEALWSQTSGKGTCCSAEDEDSRFPLGDNEDDFFRRHWETNVLQHLPSVFQRLQSLSETCEGLRSAILALSVRHWFDEGYDTPSAPSPTDSRLGLKGLRRSAHRYYYSKAIEWVMQESRGGINGNELQLIVTFISFAYLEIQSGTFQGLCFHMSGIEKSILGVNESLLKSMLGMDLIDAWTSLRLFTWWKRNPFGVGSFTHASLSSTMLGLVETALANDGTQQALMLLIEARRLSLMVLMERFFGRGGDDPLASRCLEHYYRRLGVSEPTEDWQSKERVPDQDYRQELEAVALKLAAWHDDLPLARAPIDKFIPAMFRPNPKPSISFTVYPLHFSSHDAALAYAYYALANLLCDPKVLEEATSATVIDREQDNSSSPWLLLFLRVIYGMNSTNQWKSPFMIDVIDLLFEAVCRNTDLRIDNWILQWLKNIGRGQTEVNSGLSTGVSLCTIYGLRAERLAGRDVFCCLTYGDGSYDSPDSQTTVERSVVYFRDRQTARLQSAVLDMRGACELVV